MGGIEDPVTNLCYVILVRWDLNVCPRKSGTPGFISQVFDDGPNRSRSIDQFRLRLNIH